MLVYDRLDSTNTRAAEFAVDPGNEGVVVLADEQLAGRGQHGRQWLCPPGEGVLLSVLLCPPPPVRRPVVLTAWAGVSVCETVDECTPLRARVKWPNDVLVEGRKVCGILIEQGRGTVVGIGLNVNQSGAAFDRAALPQAGSLSLFAGGPLNRRFLAQRLIERLDREYEGLCRDDGNDLETRWRERIGLVGRRVAIKCLDRAYEGSLRGLTWDGLTVELPGGQIVTLPPEGVRHMEAL